MIVGPLDWNYTMPFRPCIALPMTVSPLVFGEDLLSSEAQPSLRLGHQGV